MIDPLSLNNYLIRKEVKIIGRPTYDVLNENGEVVMKARQKNLLAVGVPDFIISDQEKKYSRQNSPRFFTWL